MKIEYPPVPDNSLFKFNADSNEWFVKMKNGLQFFIGDWRTEPEMHQILCDHMYRCWIDKNATTDEQKLVRCEDGGFMTECYFNAESWRKLGKEMK